MWDLEDGTTKELLSVVPYLECLPEGELPVIWELWVCVNGLIGTETASVE